MSHEQTELITAVAGLGAVGDFVSTEAVEGLFSSTASANAVAKFRYADAKCRTAVRIIIPAKSKAGRKKSPSSYFSTSPAKHKVGCTRRAPMREGDSSAGATTRPAAPHRSEMPAVWVSNSGEENKASVSSSSDAASTASWRSRVSTVGGGRSIGRVATVKKLAGHWETAPPSLRASAPLKAAWNPGGTYGSAFFELSASPPSDSPSTAEHVLVGTVDSIVSGKTGFTIVLHERHGDGLPLWVWLKDIVRANSVGEALWSRLAGKAVSPGGEDLLPRKVSLEHARG